MNSPLKLVSVDPPQKAEPEVKSETLKNVLHWLGMILTIVVPVVLATIWITSAINSAARDNRLELKSDLALMQQANKTDIAQYKQDVLAQTYRLQDNLQTVSDRTDEKLEKITSQLATIDQKIRN